MGSGGGGRDFGRREGFQLFSLRGDLRLAAGEYASEPADRQFARLLVVCGWGGGGGGWLSYGCG